MTKKSEILHKFLNKTNGQIWCQKSQTSYNLIWIEYKRKCVSKKTKMLQRQNIKKISDLNKALIPKNFKIPYHIESLDTYIKH